MAHHGISRIADDVARLVLKTFDTLPAKCRPKYLPEGRREWVPLAGLVMVKGNSMSRPSRFRESHGTQDHNLSQEPCMQCVSVATGMKCLSKDKLPLAKGNIIHDWHAEVLAIRGFNRWILDECEVLTKGGSSAWLQRKESSAYHTKHSTSEVSSMDELPLFELQPNIDIHMYVSSAPCGDASMELIMAAQNDSAPWTTPAPSAHPDDMLGRGHFDQLGVVRRKPSRPDAPATLSKSCSDKLAMKQCTSLLSGTVAKLVDTRNVYLKSLILPEKEAVPAATQRAFGSTGRMASLTQEGIVQQWKQIGFTFIPCQIETTSCGFAFSKTEGAVSSNVAALWTPRRQEALVNGILMGRKQYDPRGASCVSRRSLWQSVVKIAEAAGIVLSQQEIQTYRDFKSGGNANRRAVKEQAKELALQNWRRNEGDEDWTIAKETI